MVAHVVRISRKLRENQECCKCLILLQRNMFEVRFEAVWRDYC